MQTPTIAPLRAIALATALVASTGIGAAALVSTPDDTEAKTVVFETASDVTNDTTSTSTPAEAPAPAPILAPAPAPDGGTVAPGPSAAHTATAPASANQPGTAVEAVAGDTTVPLSASALIDDPAAAVADVLALLPDRAELTAAVTQCIDELRPLVPDVPFEIDRDAGLRGLFEGLFDGMRDGMRDRTSVALPDPAAITESIDVCVTLLRDVLPGPEELRTVADSLAGEAALPTEVTALVDQMRQLFTQLKESERLAVIDPQAALDALRSLIPAQDGGGESPVIGILEALLGRFAPPA